MGYAAELLLHLGLQEPARRNPTGGEHAGQKPTARRPPARAQTTTQPPASRLEQVADVAVRPPGEYAEVDPMVVVHQRDRHPQEVVDLGPEQKPEPSAK